MTCLPKYLTSAKAFEDMSNVIPEMRTQGRLLSTGEAPSMSGVLIDALMIALGSASYDLTINFGQRYFAQQTQWSLKSK